MQEGGVKYQVLLKTKITVQNCQIKNQNETSFTTHCLLCHSKYKLTLSLLLLSGLPHGITGKQLSIGLQDAVQLPV